MKVSSVIDSNSAIAKAMNTTNRLQEVMNSSGAFAKAINSAERLQEMMGSNSAIAKAMNTTNRLQEVMNSSGAIAQSINSAKRLQEMMGSNSAIAKAMNTTNRLQEVMNSSGAFAKAINSAERLQEMMGSNSAIAKAMNTTNRLQEVMNSSGAFAKAINSAERLQKMVGLNSAITESILMSSAFNQSLITLVMPENFTSAISLIEQELVRQDYEALISEDDASEEIIIVSLDSISENNNFESFETLFSRIPFSVKIILIFMIMQIILPLINNISANLMTPYVDEVISEISDRDKVGVLKKIDLKEIDVPLKSLRFISGNNIRLRSEPTIKSEVVDMFRLGQVVVFLGKHKNWTNVMIQYENKEVISGWVFTRYVKKFRTSN